MAWTPASAETRIVKAETRPAFHAEFDLGMTPDSSAAGASNAAVLNAFFADPQTNYRQLFIPGKRYFISDTITIPAYAGGASIFGVGTLGPAVSQATELIRFSAISTLCWVGGMQGTDPTAAMIRCLSERCTFRGFRMEGASVPTGDISDFPTAANRVAYMIEFRHPNDAEIPGGLGGASGVHSGKTTVENMQFNFGNVAIYLSHDEVETHCDEGNFNNLFFDVVGTYFRINNLQAIGNGFTNIFGYSNRLGGSTTYAPTIGFDFVRSGSAEIRNFTFNTAGGTAFKFGASDGTDYVKRPITAVTVRSFWVDGALTSAGHTLDRDFKLVEADSQVGDSVEFSLKIEGGSMGCNAPAEDLLRPNINARTAVVTLASPAATFDLKARRTNMPTSLVVAQGTAGVSLAGGVLTVTLDIAGGNNTVTHLANVIAAQTTKYRVANVTNGSSTISTSTTGTAAISVLDTPIVKTRGTDSVIQLGLWNLDEVTQRKYPMLQNLPQRTYPKYADAFHLPTAFDPRVMPDVTPSTSLNTTLAAALCWFEADFDADLTIASGKVSDWADHSSSNNDLTQATAGERPLYKPQLFNHRAGLHFINTGDGDFLTNASTTSFHALNDVAIYSVFTLDTLTGTQQTVVGVYSPDSNNLSWRQYIKTDGTVALETSTDGSTSAATTGVGPLLRYTPNLVAQAWDGTAGTVTTIANGVYAKQSAWHTATLHNATGADFQVSGHVASSARISPLQGAMTALIIVPSATLNDDILDYLRAKYGCN